jgi:hypothetical protein
MLCPENSNQRCNNWLIFINSDTPNNIAKIAKSKVWQTGHEFSNPGTEAPTVKHLKLNRKA